MSYQAGNGLTWIEPAQANAQVDGASGEEPRDAGEESGRAVVEGWAFGGTGEVGDFKRVGVDRNAPGIGERSGGAGVIGVAVSEQNRGSRPLGMRVA